MADSLDLRQKGTLMAKYVQWFDYPGEPTGAAGDLLDITYQQIRPLTHSDIEAETLTSRVFQRTRRPLAPWLLRQPTLARLQILITSVVVTHRRNTASDPRDPRSYELRAANLSSPQPQPGPACHPSDKNTPTAVSGWTA